MTIAEEKPLLDVRHLAVHYHTSRGLLKAVDGASLSVGAGETLGVVGESGCGKSTLGQAVMGLVEAPGEIAGGQIFFAGEDLREKSPEALRQLRGARISMIFQDPTATLNPVLPIGEQIAEMLHYHSPVSRAEARERVVEMLSRVGIPQARARYGSYPHEFSGGMQQRVIIACALILEPQLVIADEPTTALDVTVQAQILELLWQLQESAANTAVILISHDLGVVAQMCERVCVMYAGETVEIADIARILGEPRHPYTAGLIQSIPRPDGSVQQLTPIPGGVADAIHVPRGCKFQPRCPQAHERCREERPALRPAGNGTAVACHLYDTSAA